MKHVSRLFLCVLFCLCAVLTGCRAGERFTGSRTVTADAFLLEYTLLDQQESATLTLSSGDALRVTLAHTRGTADVTVGLEGAEPIYEGKGLTDMAFTLTIHQGGEYRVAVTGHSAEGSAAFTVRRSDGARAAYQFVLQQLAFEHVWPDGQDAGFDGSIGFIEENFFALCDVNGDGAEELIVRFVTADDERQAEAVFAWDASSGTARQVLSAAPGAVYFPGLAQAFWRFGPTLAGDGYQPYDLYQFDAAAGEYILLAEVNMWSRSVDTVDFKGDPYPDALDAEGAGTVFILTRNGVTETVCKRDYDAWLSSVFDGAEALILPFQPLTEQNIKALTSTGS